MSTPPPLPSLPFDRESLRRELRQLETGELLALGAGLRRNPARLALYLEVLRERTGAREELAACLVCFDLARLGHATAQRELFALIPTIQALAEDPALVAELAGDDPYLLALWDGCRKTLAGDDPRELGDNLAAEAVLAAEADLVSDLEADLDLDRLAADARNEEHARAFAFLTAEQLGYDFENDVMPTVSGLSTNTSGEVERFENYLRQAQAYATTVPLAKGVACLGQLFLAAHLRRHRFFGKPNPRRVEALRQGLLELPDDPEPLAAAAGLVEEEGEPVVERFQKVSEILLDYLRFCSQREMDPLAAATVEEYVAADRMPPPMLLRGASRRRR
ncbi:MAG TPA: hypothetical protein VGD74_05515 [Vulgatibacter sp.]